MKEHDDFTTGIAVGFLIIIVITFLVGIGFWIGVSY